MDLRLSTDNANITPPSNDSEGYSGRKIFSDNYLSLEKKIKSFRELNKDWNSYGAEAPSANAIAASLAFIELIESAGQGERLYFATPGPDGQILVELKNGAVEAEIEFAPEGTAELAIFKLPDNELLYDGELSLTVLYNYFAPTL